MDKYKKCAFNIYVEESSSTNSQYTISVSQDNWAYAPYSAMATGNNSHNNGENIKQIYIPNEKIIEILINSVTQGETEDFSYLGFPKKYEDILSCYNTETNKNWLIEATEKLYGEKIYNALKNGDVSLEQQNDLNNWISPGATLTGVVLLLYPNASKLNTIVILVGGNTVTINTYLTGKLNDLNNALINGQYNICIYLYSAYSALKLNEFYQNGYSPWNNYKYINKYQYYTYTNQNTSIQSLEIYCTITTFEDGEEYIKYYE